MPLTLQDLKSHLWNCAEILRGSDARTLGLYGQELIHITAAIARKGKILFIDAVNEVARERAQSFMKPEHQARILKIYKKFTDDPGFAKVASNTEVLEKDGNLSIPRYVRPAQNGNGNGNRANDGKDLKKAWKAFEAGRREFWEQMDGLTEMLDNIVADMD